MENKREGLTENFKWTAFMKLKGQTWARREHDILDEFDGFVKSLRGVGVDYNIIVTVEGGVPRQLVSEYDLRDTNPRIARRGSGA